MLARRGRSGGFFDEPFFRSFFGEFPSLATPVERYVRGIDGYADEYPFLGNGFGNVRIRTFEENGECVVSIPLPGIDPATLDLEVRSEQVSVKTKDANEKNKVSVSVSFSRQIEPELARADSKFGVLRISAPFAGNGGRKIEISCDEKKSIEAPKETENTAE